MSKIGEVLTNWQRELTKSADGAELDSRSGGVANGERRVRVRRVGS